MITVGTARCAGAALLRACGMPPDAADETARVIVLADAWGVPSHGLLRLPYYLRRFTAGGYQAGAILKSTSDTGPLVSFDGGAGIGHWQAWRAAGVAAERADRYGVAAVSVANSGHCGALGAYLLPLLRAGLVGMVMSNGPAAMPPWGGTEPVVSTSPVAFGFPTGDGTAIVDLASSAITRGAIAHRARTGEPLPPGSAFDDAGRPTTDPAAALRGMLAPLGGAKGFALALGIEALTGGLIGPVLSTGVVDPFSAELAGQPQGIAHLVVAFAPHLVCQDGSAPDRFAALAESVAGAGGRMPGSGRADPDDIPDDTPLQLDGELRTALDEWADRLDAEPAAHQWRAR